MGTILTYRIGTEVKRFDDIKHREIRVCAAELVDPGQELLCAVKHGSDLTGIKRKIDRCAELHIKGWLYLCSFDVCLDYLLQGSVERGDYYCAHLDHFEVKEANLKLASKILKVTGRLDYSGDALPRLIAALRTIKAVEISHDEIGQFFYLTPKANLFSIESPVTIDA